MTTAVSALVASESAQLAGQVRESVLAFAAALGERPQGRALGVIFYGSALRSGDLDGLLDFYVIVEHLRDWRLGPLLRAANRLLPPHVEYVEQSDEGRVLCAKVAVMDVAQFAELVRPGSLNTTIWARFSQPVALLWSRDDEARRHLTLILAQAVTSAAGWAYALGPSSGSARDFWRNLYSHTYRAELRVERHSGRASGIVEAGGERYDRLLVAAWGELGLSFKLGDAGRVVKTGAVPPAFTGWNVRRGLGKPLNIARLVKAAFTFENGAAYLAWKIERHSGVALGLSPWQKRHPVLSGPAILWRLWRHGTVR